jgi:hypothetical protein
MTKTVFHRYRNRSVVMVAGEEMKVWWQIFNDFTRNETNAQVTQLNDWHAGIPQGNVLTPENVSVNVAENNDFHGRLNQTRFVLGFP